MWHNPIGRERIGQRCKDSQSRASPNRSGGRRFAATSARDNFLYSIKRETPPSSAREPRSRHRSPATPAATREISRGSSSSSNGHPQRRHGDRRRRPRRDRQAKRSASAEGEEREGAVQLLQGRQERGPGQHQGRRRVAGRRGGRGDRVRGAGAGAGRRADVDGGNRAEPRAEQQPAGLDPPGGLRPHLVALHRLHLGPRRGRGVRRTLSVDRSCPVNDQSECKQGGEWCNFRHGYYLYLSLTSSGCC